MPVWQAIRPLGRALSVHQGKGRTDEQAQLSALGEAAESHAAEMLRPDIFDISHADLQKHKHVVNLLHLRAREGRVPDVHKIRHWTQMIDARTGEPVFVPHACVSLDYTLAADPDLDRSSTGLGAGMSWDQAISKGLFECLERDALGNWLRCASVLRIAREIERDTLPSGWGDPWTEILSQLNIHLRIFSIPSVTSVATIVCSLRPAGRNAPVTLPTFGSACTPDPESALFAAFAEAVQSRLTLIAAARDDVMPAEYATNRGSEFCPPLPPGWRGKPWSEATVRCGSCDSQINDLADAGFKQVLIRRLTLDEAPWKVVKVIVPGLGNASRRRRYGQ